MKTSPGGTATFLAAALCASTALAAPAETISAMPGGRAITPASSQQTIGKFAHTNLHIFWPAGQAELPAKHPSGAFETPASLACIYSQVKITPGCNPETLTAVAQGGSKVVVIVDAYDDPNAMSDLRKYARQFGLPMVTDRNFQVVYAGGAQPAQDPTGGWELEESLDIEMAHALAPKAKVILVEANSNSFDDLFAAETVAAGIAATAGGGEVSNSWSGAEFGNELSDEGIFTGTNVVFFAAAGDLPGVGVPAALSNVVSVGGTQINRDTDGNYVNQSIWYSSGGGISQYVPIPSYQSVIAAIVGNFRGVPDVGLDASLTSGVWVYDTIPYAGQTLEWVVVGGTSVASPAMAAIVNGAGSFAANSVAELTTIYANLGNKRDFKDIKRGECANGTHLQGWPGWDPCTGVGAPRGKGGK